MQQINHHLPTEPLAKPSKDEAERTKFNRKLEQEIDELLLGLSSGNIYTISSNWQKFKALCGEPGSLKLRQKEFLWQLGLLYRKTKDKQTIIDLADGLCQNGIPRHERAELLEGLKELRIQVVANGIKSIQEDTKKSITGGTVLNTTTSPSLQSG